MSVARAGTRRGSRPALQPLLGTVGHRALLLLPGALVAYLGLEAGGFFPSSYAFAALLVLLVIVLRTTLADQPFAGLGRGVALAAIPLALLALWTLCSAAWSGAPARALLEYDRTLLYLAVLVLFGSIPRTEGWRRWMVGGLAAGLFAVVVAGLVSRVLPEVLPTEPNLANNRLSWPLTYWNALGVMAAFAVVLAFHLTASEREHRVVRVVAAAGIPIGAAAILFTFSRGSFVVVGLGLLLYAGLARPRALLPAVLAVAPAAGVALLVAWRADLLASDTPTTPEAVAQGHDVALVLALAAAGAALLRALLLPLDGRLVRLEIGAGARRRARLAALAVAGVALLGGVVAGAPGAAATQFEAFLATDVPPEDKDLRTRLTSPANTYRIDHWSVAVRAFGEAPLHGSGAGTYPLEWAREREISFDVVDAHSLYVEVLGELGLVGLLLLLAVLGALLTGLGRGVRGPDRASYAVLFTLAAMWAVHAGVDWDWEMPAVTLWLFAVGGAALARPITDVDGATPVPSNPRLVVALGWLAVAISPMVVTVSDTRVSRTTQAFENADCRSATSTGLQAIRTLAVRPEPYLALGICNVRAGTSRQGVRAIREGLERDPDDWQLQLSLAVTQAAAGEDPRPAIRRAVRLNPRDEAVRDAARRLRSRDPATWRRQGLVLAGVDPDAGAS
jgi:hypothetical protein